MLGRVLYTATLVVIAVLAASAGVLAWRHFNPAQSTATVPPSPQVVVPESSLKVGDRRPDVQLKDLDGRLRGVSEWDGQLLFVNFWATWCPPCVEEIPAFQRLYERYREQGVVFLGIALDSPEKVRQFMAQHNVTYESLHGEKDAIDAARAFGNSYGALPFTAVVGRDGRIVKLHAGVLDEADAEALIKAHS